MRARTGVAVRIDVTLRVAGAVWSDSLPAVENMAGGVLGESVTSGLGVVVGPAVIGVSRLFSAIEVRIAAYGSDREPVRVASRPKSPHSRQIDVNKRMSASQAKVTGFRPNIGLADYPI